MTIKKDKPKKERKMKKEEEAGPRLINPLINGSIKRRRF